MADVGTADSMLLYQHVFVHSIMDGSAKLGRIWISKEIGDIFSYFRSSIENHQNTLI